ncbi:hypothetical protein [Vagococcus acidifermentans]|uniref:Uncharacterized protein n=1 Tax=Vagococcus acidifermentans TaxID=564710 RepID=A0A430B2F1_9ENTE|nr:hypothetical protein [Vagococcus acidifermentans]RSU14510.1 hypothetical protein CBF27_00550 [Vagococcus acidifermentans]
MAIHLDVCITDTDTRIQLADSQGTIMITDSQTGKNNATRQAICFLLKKQQLVAIGPPDDTLTFDQIITLCPPETIDRDKLAQLFQMDANNKTEPLTDIEVNVAAYHQQVKRILETFGYPLFQKKARSGKVQHRWRKDISQLPFYVDYQESKATIIWEKRTVMRIKAGATLKAEPALNKDGSLGLSARMGEQLRTEHKHKISGLTTTEDILLKSVNEVGLFLYYAGTNSWLVLKDTDGKTIDEWTRVDS